MDEIREFLVRYISSQFGADPGRVEKSENLFGDGIIDSFGFVEMVIQIEKRFSISLAEDALMSGDFRNVDGMSRVIANQPTK